MAVTLQNSVEYAAQHVTTPSVNVNTTEQHGRVRVAYFSHDQSGAGDAGSSVALVKLPAGRVRLLGSLSRAYVNWTTAAATLDLGWDAYTNMAGAAVAADPDGLVDGLAVETAAFYTLEGAIAANLLTGGTFVFESKSGVVIRATSPGAIAAGDDIAGCLFYVVD